MPIIRNPFKKNDENVRPPPTVNGAEKPPNSSNSSQQFNVNDKEPVEYKLSGELGCAQDGGLGPEPDQC